MNTTQADLAEKFRAGIMGSIETHDVRHDGGGTLNLFQSLRCYQDYLDWPFREEFLERRGIKEENGRLLCVHLTPPGTLRYAQGLAELQTKFEAHPLGGDE